MTKSSFEPQGPAFLSGGGEMGERMRAHDWASTSLGAPDRWPPSLKTIVRIMLTSRQAMWCGWGHELIFLYNDAYRPITGTKHPTALGKPCAVVWQEIWDDISPRLAHTMSADEGTYDEAKLLIMERNGYPEETYFTFSYSPIPDDSGRAGGVFCANTEVTQQVIGERQLSLLRDLASCSAAARTQHDACEQCAKALGTNPLDLPFALIYMAKPDGKSYSLAGVSGMHKGEKCSPETIDADDTSIWPIADALQNRSIRLVPLENHCETLPPGAWGRAPSRAAVIPMLSTGERGHAGALIVGLNPFRLFDDSYQGFLNLAAGQLSASIASAEAYEEEKKRVEALAQLDRAKTAFFSNVSHEFRTPLTLMLGPIEELLARSHTDLSPAATSQLELANRNGLRLLRLVNSLLDFSRIEAGRVRAMYQPTDLAIFTTELASVFRSMCERGGLNLIVDCPALEERVYVDREMWEKIVLNLLSNAFKFTFTGDICVSLHKANGSAVLTVQDTGTGIPASEMPRLFERFHRVENANGRTHEGSGIGLALVQELVKLHGGTVHAESALGKGTAFSVSIPLGSAHLPQDQIGGSRVLTASVRSAASPYIEEAMRWLPEDISTQRDRANIPIDDASFPLPFFDASKREHDDRLRVLVADDNADMRLYIARLMSDHYRVEAVSNGEEALASIRQSKPDLVLTDVMMPRLDGFGLLREIRASAETCGLPVIMLSARAGEESRVDGMSAGADDYIIKPFSARELLARVAAHIQMARMRRDSEQAIVALNDELRARVEELTALLDVLPIGVFVAKDADCTVITANKAGSTMLGCPPESNISKTNPEGVQLPFRVIRHGVEIAVADLPMQRAARLGIPVLNEELEVARADGSVLTLLELAVPLFDRAGKVRGCLGAFVDITERKSAEAERQKLADRFAEQSRIVNRMLSSITDFAYTFNREGRFTFVNKPLLDLWGLTLEQAIGKNFFDLNYPDELAAKLQRQIQYVFETGESLSDETPYTNPAGSEGYYQYIYAPVTGPDGTIDAVAGSTRDISERRRTEQALRESEERYRTLFNSMDQGFCAIDVIFNEQGYPVDYLFLEVNPAFEKQTGISNAAGRRAREFAGDREQHWFDIYGKIAVTGERARFINVAKALNRWYDVNAFKIGGPESRKVAIFFSDITELRRNEEQLKEADRRKDDFIATLAHELRNPLAPLRMGLQIIRLKKNDVDIVERNRAMMERQLDQMVRLVDDLLDVSRISRGKVELIKHRMDVASSVQSAIETARPLIEQAGHALTVTLPSKTVYLDGDSTRLSQVFSNLLNNAAKFTPRGGHIKLTLETQGRDAIVVVKDDGVGIPRNMLSKVFEIFTQLNRPLNNAQSGLGIGLSLVKGLVELHGGRVEAQSAGIGTGSEFIVRLPLNATANFDSSAEGSEGSHNELPGVSVLVVDDNRDNTESLALFLELAGNTVNVAFDGLEAIEVAERIRPDVILLDIGMPHLDGYETCRRIRQQPWGKDIYLIAQTGWGSDADRRRTEEAGFNIHIVKPVDPDALIRKINSVKPKH